MSVGPVIEFEQEEDGRWIADVPAHPGVMAYGNTKEAAEIAALRLLLVVAVEVEREACAHEAETTKLPLSHHHAEGFNAGTEEAAFNIRARSKL